MAGYHARRGPYFQARTPTYKVTGTAGAYKTICAMADARCGLSMRKDMCHPGSSQGCSLGGEEDGKDVG
ncbi:hypothetical protein HIM_00139 [Hirsutella minnesotensis 3608]|nr:hypothetical protein HIM_00139 [Hirsutella minnesotensis 3608]